MTCKVMTHERYVKMLSEAGMLFKSDMPLSDKDSEPNMRRFSPSRFPWRDGENLEEARPS